MSILIVSSKEPRAGRSLIAAALAYRLGRDGRAVTLARIAGDDSAAPDAATFATLDGVVSSGKPVSFDDLASLTGDVVAEAPPGSSASIGKLKNATIVSVAANPSPTPGADAGEFITAVPAPAAAAHLARAGVLAVLPEDRVLAAPSVDDIARAVNGRWLARNGDSHTIDRIMLGTVASDAAAPYFSGRERKCVVTRYDKTDIHLAALQTDLALLVLTGGGQPSPYLLDRVENNRDGVSVLLADEHTPQVMRTIEGLYRRSRFDGKGKMMRAVAMLDEQQFALDF